MPAVARRWSPAVTASTEPLGSATNVVGPLSTTVAPVVGGQPADGSEPIGRRRPVAEPGELTVVGRQHRRRVTLPQRGSGSPVRRGDGGQAVPVDDDRARGTGDHLPRLVDGRWRQPQPGTDHDGTEARQVGEHVGTPACRRSRLADDLDELGAGVRSARGRQPHDPAAGAHRRRGHQRSRTGHPRAPGDHPHRPRPLVGVRRAGPPPAGDVGSLHGVRSRRRHVEADVSDGHLAGEALAGADEQARLESGERHRRRRLEGAVDCVTGEPIDAARNVHGQHGGRTDSRRCPGAVESGAIRGVDDEVGGREFRTRCRVEDAHRDPRLGEQAAGDSPVGTVVALPGDHVDDAAIRTPEHAAGAPGDGRAGPAHQDVDRFCRGGVDLAHLGRRDDRDHAAPLASATTMATAMGPS